MAEKPFVTDPSGGSAVLFVPGQRLAITMADSPGEGAYEMKRCTVVGCSGQLVEVEFDGKKIIVNTAGSTFVKAIREQ